MTQTTTTALDAYHAAYEETKSTLPGSDTPWVTSLREEAIQIYKEHGWPTTKLEAWKYTNLAAVRENTYKPATSEGMDLTLEDLDEALIDALDAHRIVLVNGHVDPGLSTHENAEHITVASLAETLNEAPGRLEGELGEHANVHDAPFLALNTASFPDGVLVHVPEGAIAEKPVHIVHVTYAQDEPVITHPRTLIIAEPGSEIDVVESFVSFGQARSLTNGATEVSAHPNATVRHVKLQREEETSDHLWTFDTTQQRDSAVRAHNLIFGARITRNEVFTTLAAEGCDTTLNGFYFGIDEQHIDTYTKIRHAEPHGTSHQLYKGILDDASRGVFRGTIYVAPDAQRTDGYQHNPNLLLSNEAEANSVPQLEIFADDVKCSHGSTTGEMDDSWIWYMRSRGVNEEDARAMLVYAFANDVLEMIELEPVRTLAQRLVLERLEQDEQLLEAR